MSELVKWILCGFYADRQRHTSCVVCLVFVGPPKHRVVFIVNVWLPLLLKYIIEHTQFQVIRNPQQLVCCKMQFCFFAPEGPRNLATKTTNTTTWRTVFCCSVLLVNVNCIITTVIVMIIIIRVAIITFIIGSIIIDMI